MTRLSYPTTSPYPEKPCCQEASTGFPVEIYNRPGLLAICYRCGTHSQFKQFMLSQLSASNREALHALTTREYDDCTIALIDALSVMSDVLTFYQERIAQESYLRTATERFSITHMARFVGYKPKPGLAAATCLAFTLDSSPGSRKTVNIPERTQAQSIPKEQDKLHQDKLPQTFETTESLTARVEWNELRPRMTRTQTVILKPDIAGEAGEVFLKRANLNLQTGDVLLFMNSNDKEKWNIVRIANADSEPQFNRTRVSWFWPENEVQQVAGEANDVKVFVFRERANIFGFNAPDWRSLPDVAKATYIGIDDHLKLTKDEKIDWPDYYINAPVYPLAPRPAYREVPPTVESVAAAITRNADAILQSAILDATTALPIGALTALVELLNVIRSAVEIGRQVGEGVSDAQTSLQNEISNLEETFNDILKTIIPSESKFNFALDKDFLKNLTEIFPTTDDFAGASSSIVSALFVILEKTPAMVPYTILSDLQSTFAQINESFENAGMAIGDIPGKIAEAGGSAFVAIAVKATIKAALDAPLPFPKTPELIAFIALYTVRIIDLASDFPEEIPDILTNAEKLEKLKSTLANPLIDPDFHAEAELVAEATFAVAGPIGALTTFSAAALIAAVYPPIILPSIGILLLAALAFALLKDEIQEGICKAILAILKAKDNALETDTQVVRNRWILSGDSIDLDKSYPQIVAGQNSWLLLSKPDRSELYNIEDTTEVSRADFTLNAKVTRVALENADFCPKEEDDENAFRKQVRMTTVFANSEMLEISEAPDISPIIVGPEGPGNEQINCVTLDQRIPDLEKENGRRLIMTGLSRESEPQVDLLTLRKQDINGDCSRLFFSERPGGMHKYQRDSVRIFANVAPATHGATVEEILGSGDAAQALQTFKLRQPPVTYVTSEAETGSTSTLEVWVNVVLWEEVPFLHGIGPRRRAYSTETDDSGQTMLRFGDGLDGARPHTGVENIRARYRSGIGTEGNVGAGDISLLTRRPQGVVNVNNPLPAKSGNDAESPSNLRSNIPSTTRILDRIVSLRDYEDFATSFFPDVHKARAVQQGYGPDRKVHVTVAGNAGSYISATPPDNRLRELQNDMRKAGDPHIHILVQNYVQVQFVLAAQITCEYDQQWENISSAVCKALANHFAFDSRQFGQPVTVLEIMALIQGVAGVTAVDVDQLYRWDKTVQTAPPSSPSGFSIVSEESSSTSSSAIVAAEEKELKISFNCTDSDTDYKEKVNNYHDVLPGDLRASPQELLLSRKIVLLFKEDKRI